MLWVDFCFFFPRLYCFILNWQLSPSSIALRAFACALRLSPHTASRPRGAPGGWLLCSATGGKGVPERLRSRGSAHAEGGCGQAGGGGRAQALGGGRACAQWPRCCEKHTTAVFTLFTAPGPAAPLCSSLQLCSCLAGGVGVGAVFCVYFFKLGEEPNSYCPRVPGKPRSLVP